jgi:hypothetical protein
MSIRKQYACCGASANKLNYIEKHIYPDPTRRDQRVSGYNYGNQSFGNTIFDDGIESQSQSQSPINFPSHEEPLMYSLNKRKRWQIMSTLPQLMEDHHAEFPPVSCIIRRGTHHTQPRSDMHKQDVVSVSSTLFPARAKTSEAGMKRINKTSTLRNLVENALKPVPGSTEKRTSRPAARQAQRGASRIIDRKPEKPERTPAAAANSQPPIWMSGTVYEIGIPHDSSSHIFRKDRHAPGKSEKGTKSLTKTKYGRHFLPNSSGHNFLPEILDIQDDREIPEKSDNESDSDNIPDTFRSLKVKTWTMAELIESSTAKRTTTSDLTTSTWSMLDEEDSSFDSSSDSSSEFEMLKEEASTDDPQF